MQRQILSFIFKPSQRSIRWPLSLRTFNQQTAPWSTWDPDLTQCWPDSDSETVWLITWGVWLWNFDSETKWVNLISNSNHFISWDFSNFDLYNVLHVAFAFEECRALTESFNSFIATNHLPHRRGTATLSVPSVHWAAGPRPLGHAHCPCVISC